MNSSIPARKWAENLTAVFHPEHARYLAGIEELCHRCVYVFNRCLYIVWMKLVDVCMCAMCNYCMCNV